MPTSTAPQRFLANHRNLIAAATLTPSDVQAVSNSVVETQIARKGTAALKLSGSYTGLVDALFEFEVTDDSATTKLVSAPVFAGAGSETLTDIEADDPIAPQRIVVECHSAGSSAKAAAVDIEGVAVVARAAGVAGNAITIDVDVSGLVYAATPYSLLEDVKKGDGSTSAPLDGPQFDYDAQAVGSDDVIPAGAHRLVFEGDRQTVYVQFKKFVDGGWKYYCTPELQNDYPAGTKILFVSGSYAVTITDGVTPETLTGIVTVYDFLNGVKTTSVLCDVDGVIANDRTPTGQAAKDFPVRTKARALLSTGDGSKAAKGFADVVVQDDANTELVTAECIAIDFKLDPFAHVGHEAWDLAGSVSAALGRIYTGEPFIGEKFALTIPARLPPTTTGPNAAQFSMTARNFQGASIPDVCFFGALGPNAQDKSFTLTYTKRQSNCACDGMPTPILDGPCLGTTGTGGDEVTWTAEAQTKVDALFDWATDLAAAVTQYIASKALPPGADNAGSPTLIAGTTSVSGASTSGGNFQGTLTNAADATSANHILVPPETVPTGYADVALPQNFADLVDYYLDGIEAIDAVTDTALRTAGFTAWDEALQAWEDDLSPSILADLGDRLYSLAGDKYKMLVKRAAAAAGVRLKKANASTQTSGDGCWQDFGGDYWTVVGSDGTAYAWFFTNHAYWFSREIEVDGVKGFYSTHEAGFIINIACPQLLTYGDTITLTIGNAGALGTYQVGDVLKLPIIAAAPLKLTGGADASRVQSWYVTGSVVGALPVYVFDPDAPGPYVDSAAGISFLLVMGGVDPVAGDAFTFVVEGAHFRWRKNGDVWSADIAIPDGAAALDDGLSYEFVRGASPSFVTGDAWAFRALQPWSAENIKSPDRARWFPGTGSAPATLQGDFDSIKTFDAIAIALHTIPEGAAIQVVGGDVAGITDWTETLTWSAGPIVKFVDRHASWARLELDVGAGSAAAWWFVGIADKTQRPANFRWREKFLLERGQGGGSYQGGVFLGKAVSGVVSWPEAALTEADVTTVLRPLLRQVKTNNDEAFIFVPNATRPADALFAQVTEDEIEIADLHDYQRNVDHPRELSASLTLAGAWE